jgi:hypothetical protein
MPDRGCLALDQVDARELAAAIPHHALVLERAGEVVLHPVTDYEALARQPHRGLEAHRQRQPPVARREVLPAGRFAGDACRLGMSGREALDRIARRVEKHVARGSRRRNLARIDDDLLAVAGTMQQIEPAAAEPRAVRLDDGERGADRDGGVERVAAAGENLHPGLGGERMRGSDRSLAGRRRCEGRQREQRGGEYEQPLAADRHPAGVDPARLTDHGHLTNLLARASATIGCTNSRTLPPRLAISRISVEDTKLNCSLGVRNTVSTSPFR